MAQIQGPAVPVFILRGHTAPIHALHFFHSNSYLASGDGDGWIVVWSLATKRPVAVWKGHEGGVMGLKDWNSERLLSHGRDHHLRVWHLTQRDYESTSVKLPVDGATTSESQWPWLLFSVTANALNYCSFSMCEDPDHGDFVNNDGEFKPLLLACPNGLDTGGIDIFQLPSARRVCKLASDKDVQTGMVMAVSLFNQDSQNRLVLVSGYESGHIIVHSTANKSSTEWRWRKLLCSQPHQQPVLAIDTTRNFECFMSSSADALIAKFKIPQDMTLDNKAVKVINTKHAGQQDLNIRDDGKIFVTAGWDKRLRVYSVKTMRELAVLKWHQEGCYAVAFGETATSEAAEQARQHAKQNNSVLVGSTLEVLKTERSSRAQKTHWLAAGGKDGKVSLWDIY